MTFTTASLNIIYCRVSSGTQNLDEQEYACRQYCRTNNMSVNAIIREVGSARYGINNLPNLQDTIFNMGMPFNLIVWSVDRLTRTSSEDLYGLLMEKQINVITVNRSYDFNGRIGRLFWDELVLQAERESNLISERVIRSVEYRRSIGDHIGNAGYGYKIVYVPVEKNTRFNTLTDSYINGNNHDESGQLISNVIDNNIVHTVRPVINDETHYNRRVLMYNIHEMCVVDFIKNTFEKNISCLQFMNFAKFMIDTLNLDWTPIKFYKEFDDTDEGEYTPRNEVKTYFFSYIDSTEFFNLPKNLCIANSKRIKIEDYHIRSLLNDYHITKRGEYWTRDMVKYIATRM